MKRVLLKLSGEALAGEKHTGFDEATCVQVAKQVKEVCDSGVQVGVVIGGGAKSPLWRKMIANIMNLKVDMIESEEGPALGGAMLAAVACGEYKNVEEAAEKLVKVTGTVEPDPELTAKYEEKYQQFKQIYPACKPLFEIIK